uniref:C2H2-type domain-containing protein n=1 Tax=Hucho hucho TaxID=62062 RepID=A0A4W5NPD9_9TELE
MARGQRGHSNTNHLRVVAPASTSSGVIGSQRGRLSIRTDKRFLCMFCNKGFSSPQSMDIHQRVHKGVKPFSCTQCHMRFTQSSDLKRHQRVHRGVKPFSCTQCHMCFTQSSDLKRHQRVHTGEKPYSFGHSSGQLSRPLFSVFTNELALSKVCVSYCFHRLMVFCL